MKAHLSASSLESLCRCPEAWRRYYIEQDRTPPPPAVLRGTGVHAGAAENFRQKIESHVDLPASDVIDASVAAFDLAVGEGYSLSADDAGRGADVVLGETRDDVAAMARVLAAEVCPVYQPRFVEQEFRLELPSAARDLIGFIDLATVEAQVRDFKTANKKRSQQDADNSTQLTIYSLGHRVLTGQPAADVGLEVLVNGREVSRQLLVSDRGTADYQALGHRLTTALQIIDAGVFLPAVPGTWWCSGDWCSYHRTCKYVNSERIAKAGGADKVSRARTKPRTKAVEPPAAIEPPKQLDLAPLPAKGAEVPFRSIKDRLLADNPACHLCGKLVSHAAARLDFVVPLNEGGQNVADNIRLAHAKCLAAMANQSKQGTIQ